MLLVSIAPLMFIGIQGYGYARKAMVERTQQHLVSVIRARQSLFDSWLEERKSDIGLLATLPIVPQLTEMLNEHRDVKTKRQLMGLLEAVQTSNPAYEDLHIYNADFQVLVGVTFVEESHGGTDFLSAPLKKALQDSQNIFFDAPHFHQDGATGQHLAIPLFNGVGERIGYLVANLNLSKSLTPLLQDRSGLGTSGKVYIVGPDLTILSEPRKNAADLALGSKVNELLLSLGASDGPVVQQYSDYLGVDVLGTAVRVDEMNWYIVAEMDSEEAFAWLYPVRYGLFLTVIGTLIAMFFISYWLSYLLGAPLRQLAEVASRVRQGSVDERLQPMTGTEAEEVRRAFNEMLDVLRSQQHELIQSSTLASLGELSSSVVHEMRNPLSSIKVSLKALSRKVGSEGGYDELVRIASEQVARVEKMLDDLLQYGRPLSLNRESTTFRFLSEEAVGVIRGQADAAEVGITIVDELPDSELLVDRELVCRALTNLLLNAIQASLPGDSVVIEGCIDFDRPGCGRIAVRDSGSGLSSEAEQRVFTPFFTTKKDGTGLGLANVKKIIELHGGNVGSRNGEDGGTEFWITLPFVN